MPSNHSLRPTTPVSLLEQALSVSLPEQYKSALLAYPFARGSVGEFAPSFVQYLERIRQIDSKLGAEELLGEGRARAIPEWRHTLRFYMPAAVALLVVFVVVPLIAFGIRSLYRWGVE